MYVQQFDVIKIFIYNKIIQGLSCEEMGKLQLNEKIIFNL